MENLWGNFNMTNLDIIRRYFKKAVCCNGDHYVLNKNWIIFHLQDELFTVDHSYKDKDVGFVCDGDVYDGDLIECLDFILKYEGDEKTTGQDRKDYEKIVKREN